MREERGPQTANGSPSPATSGIATKKPPPTHPPLSPRFAGGDAAEQQRGGPANQRNPVVPLRETFAKPHFRHSCAAEAFAKLGSIKVPSYPRLPRVSRRYLHRRRPASARLPRRSAAMTEQSTYARVSAGRACPREGGGISKHPTTQPLRYLVVPPAPEAQLPAPRLDNQQRPSSRKSTSAPNPTPTMTSTISAISTGPICNRLDKPSQTGSSHTDWPEFEPAPDKSGPPQPEFPVPHNKSAPPAQNSRPQPKIRPPDRPGPSPANPHPASSAPVTLDWYAPQRALS